MIREIGITLYLFVFKVIFNIFKICPLKNKITFCISFGDNTRYVLDELLKQEHSIATVLLYQKQSQLQFRSYKNIKKIPLNTSNIVSFIKSAYHLATSRYVLVDNYFGFLAATNFRKEVECIQLWHASGALKKFGLEDQSIKNRSKRANIRFKKVYNNFHKVVVGSDVMAEIFMRSFDLPSSRMLKTGIPRTDFFYDQSKQKQIIDELLKENPEIKNKKKLLYAPTYRDQQLEMDKLYLDIDEMQRQLGKDYILMVRLHPAIKMSVNCEELFTGFVYDYSSKKYDINELLLLSDYLITDYSSIPYEYSLLYKPMIFYTFDLEMYKKERGLIVDYEDTIPGPIAMSTEEIIKIINEDHFDFERIYDYTAVWNKYSKGQSSSNLVNYMLKGLRIKNEE